MTSFLPPLRRSGGFTLIEACTVAAIVAVVAVRAVPGLQSVLDARRLESAATQLGADLQLVRMEAIARNVPLRLTFFSTASGSCYLLHTGNAADCRCDDRGTAQCQNAAQAIKTTVVPSADHVTLGSNAKSLLFDPLHGTSTPTATLRAFGAQGQEVRHVVNVLGRLRSCSPAAKVPGYSAC